MPRMVLLLSVLTILAGLPAALAADRGTGVTLRQPPALVADRAVFGLSAAVVADRGAFGLPAVVLAGRGAGGAFGWPVSEARVVRRFDPPPQPWLSGHRGVDLAAEPSAVVRAAGAGTIVFAGPIAGRGVVSVAHPGGLRTTYEPVLAGEHQPGDSVAAGQVIGSLETGHPGCPAAACLHWGLRRGADYLDPLTLLGLGRMRLLPL